MVHKDASPNDHLRLTATGEPAPRQNPTPLMRTAPQEMPLRSNLPVPITSFIGRGGELVAVRQCLTEARLVTLIGAGGVGKTRLALRVAEEALEDYPDGVWLAELAPLVDATLVPHVVAAVLGVREQAGVSIVLSLKQALHHRRVLLLLDNCEHLAQPCAELAEDLLGACPHLQILATSREPLGTNGEVAWRVPSLNAPELRAPTTEQLTAHAATLLFIERASAARPDFRVTDQNAAAIGEVCRRLDGIPLALELAATRVRLLSVEQIAGRLDDRLRLLAGGRRTGPSRQQTLRATLDWSYVLLQEPERRLFNRLAVFAGSWTIDAAEAICAGGGIEPGEVLDRLGHLVDQSLVVAEEQAGQVRYRLPETMRQYAAEKLEEAGESVAMRGAHRDWFLSQAERSEFELKDPQHVAWLAEELDNLRAALRWSIQSGEIEPGLRLVTATGAFWYERGFYAEGRAWFTELQAQAGGAATTAHAAALISASILTELQGNLSAGLDLLREGLAIARQVGDTASIARGLNIEGMIALRHGDLGQAQSLLEEGLSVSQNDGLSVMRYYGLHSLGLVALERGDHKRAGALGAETLALAKRIGHARGSANALYLSARAAIISGDRPTGRDLLEKSLAMYRKYVDWDGMQWCLRGLGHLEIDQGRAAAAGHYFRESLALGNAAGDTLEVARSLEGLAGAAVDVRPDRVVRLAGTAAALREALAAAPYPWERERVDRWLGAALLSLGQEAYAAVWAEASATPVEQSVALALGDEEPARVLQTAHPADPLSAREREVIRLLAHGCSNRQIAEQLVIAARTADTHVGNILTKLSLHSRAELAAWAVEHGLMSTTTAD